MPKPKNKTLTDSLPISTNLIERWIYVIRGCKVMIDRDLVELYQVKGIALRQQVKRNKKDFQVILFFS